jgi:hypothetical protein
LLAVLAVVVVVGPLLWMLARARHGLPARARIVTDAWDRYRSGRPATASPSPVGRTG